jgi:hypothetical protein
MKKVQIELTVSSTREAEKFYCHDIEMFEFYQDYGMGSIRLVYKNNSDIFLLLREGVTNITNMPLFTLWIEDCERVFQTLQKRLIYSEGILLNNEVFEYPLGKKISLKDPSNNMFLLFEEYQS